MTNEHRQWIAAYVAAQPDRFVRGKCAAATLAMAAAFPELRRAGGIVEVEWPGAVPPIRKEQHWWCVARDGSIVDPTISQFALPPTSVDYEEIDIADPAARERMPTGRCLNCGKDTYLGRDVCNQECADAFALDCMGSLR